MYKVNRTFKTKQENVELTKFTVVRQIGYIKPVRLSKIKEIGISEFKIKEVYRFRNVYGVYSLGVFWQENMVFIKKIAVNTDLSPMCLDQLSCFCSLKPAFAPCFRFILYY